MDQAKTYRAKQLEKDPTLDVIQGFLVLWTSCKPCSKCWVPIWVEAHLPTKFHPQIEPKFSKTAPQCKPKTKHVGTVGRFAPKANSWSNETPCRCLHCGSEPAACCSPPATLAGRAPPGLEPKAARTEDWKIKENKVSKKWGPFPEPRAALTLNSNWRCPQAMFC